MAQRSVGGRRGSTTVKSVVSRRRTPPLVRRAFPPLWPGAGAGPAGTTVPAGYTQLQAAVVNIYSFTNQIDIDFFIPQAS